MLHEERPNGLLECLRARRIVRRGRPQTDREVRQNQHQSQHEPYPEASRNSPGRCRPAAVGDETIINGVSPIVEGNKASGGFSPLILRTENQEANAPRSPRVPD